MNKVEKNETETEKDVFEFSRRRTWTCKNIGGFVPDKSAPINTNLRKKTG